MDIQRTASQLLDEASAHQQTAMRLTEDAQIAELRAEIRRQARHRLLRVRTGLVDDALAVVLADADIWHMSTAMMRKKLALPPNTA